MNRVIEIVFYEFDTTVSPTNCYHVANEDDQRIIDIANDVNDQVDESHF